MTGFLLAYLCLATATAAMASAVDSTRVMSLDEVVVTGSNSAVGCNLLPYTVTTVPADRLEATGKVNVQSAI